jgi:RimJ/RimL family protein N-acetyltransferase
MVFAWLYSPRLIDFCLEMEQKMTASTLDYSRYFWQGERTRLRPFRMEDAERHFAELLDSETRQAHEAGIELPISMPALSEWLEKVVDCQDNGGYILFAIENLAGEMAGWAALHGLNTENGTFSMGAAVYRAHRGHGYGDDAARILLKYAFWEQRYQKCNLQCSSSNEASIQSITRLGFTEEGRIRRNCFFNGGYHDEVWFGMTREEFDELMKP